MGHSKVSQNGANGWTAGKLHPKGMCRALTLLKEKKDYEGAEHWYKILPAINMIPRRKCTAARQPS